MNYDFLEKVARIIIFTLTYMILEKYQVGRLAVEYLESLWNVTPELPELPQPELTEKEMTTDFSDLENERKNIIMAHKIIKFSIIILGLGLLLVFEWD